MTERDQCPEDSRIRALYRRSPGEEPSADVDRTIIAAARSSASRRRYRAPIPWAAAATLVLAVGIGWQILQVDEMPLPASAPTDTASREVPRTTAVPVPMPEPSAAPAPAGAASNIAPQRMTREETSASRVSQDTDRPARHSAVAPKASIRQRPNGCEAYELAEDAPLRDWSAAIAAARQAGEMQRADCLEQQLRLRESDATGPAGIPATTRDR